MKKKRKKNDCTSSTQRLSRFRFQFKKNRFWPLSESLSLSISICVDVFFCVWQTCRNNEKTVSISDEKKKQTEEEDGRWKSESEKEHVTVMWSRIREEHY